MGKVKRYQLIGGPFDGDGVDASPDDLWVKLLVESPPAPVGPVRYALYQRIGKAYRYEGIADALLLEDLEGE